MLVWNPEGADEEVWARLREHFSEEEIVELGQWDALRVGPDTMRALEAGADVVEVLAFGAPNTGPPREDGVPEFGWWKD